MGSLGIIAHDFDGIMGLEVRQNLLRKSNQVLKRIIDLTLSIIFITFASPILLLIMAAIKVDSPGVFSINRNGSDAMGRLLPCGNSALWSRMLRKFLKNIWPTTLRPAGNGTQNRN